MKICILSDGYEDSTSPMKAHDLPCDPSPYVPEHDWHRAQLRKATAVQQVIALAQEGYDLFFNLCDGAWDEDRPGIEVAQALERLDQAYTGATPAFWEPSREAMKRVCAAWDIPAPGYVYARTDADIERAVAMLRFPLIVKHPSSYSSIGLTPASRVTTPETLRVQTEQMIARFGQALIEEFIDGREFTVLVAENPDDPRAPTAYQPVEFRFPDGESFKHFDLKWIDFGQMTCVPCEDPGLAERLKTISRDLFVGIGGAGYGRCDLRVSEDGTPYMLEINPNCGVFYPAHNPGSADFILQHDPAGHAGFARQIIEAALRRRERRRPAFVIRSDREGNYGMFAARAIPQGGLIDRGEEQPLELVSRAYVAQHWGPREQIWFHRYAFPVTDGVYALWHADPEDWKPINHACDPNAWLEGLDLVARRAIAEGEEITMDYATFCNETMEPFTCACGAAGCRGTIRGTDYLQPFVARYGTHVSDYVQRKRTALNGAAVPRPVGH